VAPIERSKRRITNEYFLTLPTTVDATRINDILHCNEELLPLLRVTIQALVQGWLLSISLFTLLCDNLVEMTDGRVTDMG